MVTPEKKREDARPEPKAYEATYTIPELLTAAEAEFKTTTIVVRAALTKAGKRAYTLKEAKQIIDAMMKKEVKA